MSEVLIAGCGYVGGALARRLIAGGHRVWGLRRLVDELPDGTRPIAADLSDPRSLAALPPGLDTVFYTAAAESYHDEAYRRAYVEGPRHLLCALAEQGQQPSRVFFTSSTGVYGQRDGEWVDEDSVTEPEGFSGRRVLEGEAVFRSDRLPTCIVRFGGIYGPGRTRLVDVVRRGEARLDGDHALYTNRIHREDCAGVLAHLMSRPRIDDVYVAVDDDPARRETVYRWLAKKLGRPPPGRPGSDSGGRSKRCRNRRLKESGYSFAFPTFREGYASLLEED